MHHAVDYTRPESLRLGAASVTIGDVGPEVVTVTIPGPATPWTPVTGRRLG
jgi:hypothetical protein